MPDTIYQDNTILTNFFTYRPNVIGKLSKHLSYNYTNITTKILAKVNACFNLMVKKRACTPLPDSCVYSFTAMVVSKQ